VLLLSTNLAVAQQQAGRSAPAVRKGAAKTTPSAAPSGPSTLAGVYTAEQAKRGRAVYFGSCRSCHSPSTGAAFKSAWGGKSLGDLYTFIVERMPKNDPGSLAPEDAADVLTYLLQVTAMPMGPAELPADPDSLKRIRVELPKKAAAKKP
jgi:mono/diheme cytochrome c family protein